MTNHLSGAYRNRTTHVLLWMAAVPPIVLFIVGYLFSKDRETFYVAVLFSLPILIQTRILYDLLLRRPVVCRPAALVMSFGVVAYELAWVAYGRGLGNAEVLQWLSVLVALLLMFGVLAVMAASLNESLPTWLVGDPQELKDELSSHPFRAASFFFAVFLCVAYCLSFSLGFANRQETALFYGLPEVVGVTSSAPNPSPVRFFFRFGAGDLNQEWPRDRSDEGLKRFIERRETLTCDGYMRPSSISVCNAYALSQLRSFLGSLKGGSRVQVTIVGHASPEIPSAVGTDRGKSGLDEENWWISAMRVAEVRRRLSRWLEDGQMTDKVSGDSPATGDSGEKANTYFVVDWFEQAVGTKDAFLSSVNQTPTQPETNEMVRPLPLTRRDNDGWRHVEVSVVNVRSHPVASIWGSAIGRRPDLLDYVYFMMYTVTTTGYGDIVPVSGFAKWVVTLANIFEVIFLVVFFNALVAHQSKHNLSLSTPDGGGGSGDSATPRAPQ